MAGGSCTGWWRYRVSPPSLKVLLDSPALNTRQKRVRVHKLVNLQLKSCGVPDLSLSTRMWCLYLLINPMLHQASIAQFLWSLPFPTTMISSFPYSPSPDRWLLVHHWTESIGRKKKTNNWRMCGRQNSGATPTFPGSSAHDCITSSTWLWAGPVKGMDSLSWLGHMNGKVREFPRCKVLYQWGSCRVDIYVVRDLHRELVYVVQALGKQIWHV